MEEKDKRLWFLIEMGLDVLDDNNKEWTCVCPWCFDDRKHCYLNSRDILYDCKKCGAQGNYFSLLERLALNLAEDMTKAMLRRLARDRQLPVDDRLAQCPSLQNITAVRWKGLREGVIYR